MVGAGREKAVAIVGARLNSSRLPRKHLLPLSGRPMIAHIFDRLEAVPSLDQIVLATTADDYNADLVRWGMEAGKAVLAYEGDVNNLMGRADAVVRAKDADIVVYICGDCPLLEPATIDTLIRALRADPAADWSRLADLPAGRHYIHEGFMVYRRAFWDRLMAASVEPFEREHVGSAFHKLEKIQADHVAVSHEAAIFSELQHRISVDTPSDYDFMSRVYDRWYAHNEPDSLVDLAWVIHELKADTALVRINAHVHQKTVKEMSLRIQLVAAASKTVGLGHLRRMSVAARHLQDDLGAGVELVAFGDPVHEPWFTMLRHRQVADEQALPAAFEDNTDMLLVDVPVLTPAILSAVSEWRTRTGKKAICIDKLPAPGAGKPFDACYLPAVRVPEGAEAKFGAPVVGGWNCYLLPPAVPAVPRDANRLLVLSGGSDAFGLGEVWPELLDRLLPPQVAITWVQGPFAPDPDLGAVSEGRSFDVERSPVAIAGLAASHGMALTVYGVSYYECLRQGIPVLGYLARTRGFETEVATLRDAGARVNTIDPASAVKDLVALMADKAALAHLTRHDWGFDRRVDGMHPVSALVQKLATPSNMA
ncbi:MAG: hypothetical protein EP335_03555 [Alphaproteobacteria bacterium]|nr:MAG: hypothetical protein EP335_03555 [Alphaproteobacteria bacterium]